MWPNIPMFGCGTSGSSCCEARADSERGQLKLYPRSLQKICDFSDLRANHPGVSASAEERETEFERLLEQHSGIVAKVAGMYARLPEDRADLRQEIAAHLWRSFPGFDRERSISTWMYRIALNVAISHTRGVAIRATHHVPLESDYPQSPNENAAELDEAVRELYAVIEALDPLNRALLLLYLDEQSYREISEVLGITETKDP